MPEIKSTIKALEQGRASFAYDCVESVLKENEKIQGKSLLSKLSFKVEPKFGINILAEKI